MFYILYTTCSLTIFLYFHIFMFFWINRFALYLLEYDVLSVQIRRYAAVYLKKKKTSCSLRQSLGITRTVYQSRLRNLVKPSILP